MPRTGWLLFFLVAFLALALTVPLADDAEADTGPTVTGPLDFEPYHPGWVDGVIRTSTKDYDTPVRYYYPALSPGVGATPNASNAPYPCIVWLPGFGGSYNSYVYQAEYLTAHGMVVMTVGVNWSDFPRSANVSDMEDFLDHLEMLNSTPGDPLFGMVDKEAFGLSGHSSGGGLSLLDGTYVDRIKAVQTFAAAIGLSTVDSLAQSWTKPLMLQVGQEDATYIAGSRRAYSQMGYPNSLVEIIGANHAGPYMMHLFSAFYLYHLDHQEEYRTFLYGSKALDDVVSGLVDLKFKVSDDHYFPFTVGSSISKSSTAMDSPVIFRATIQGYPMSEDHPGVHEWDIDGDGVPEASSRTELNITYNFTGPGDFNVVYMYTLGDYLISATPIPITVTNVPPVAVAGPDREVDHDSFLELFDGGSTDTGSDRRSLVMSWNFSDGITSNVTPNGYALRKFTEVGLIDATLTVRDRHGAFSTDVMTVSVLNVAPTATTGLNLTSMEDRTLILSGRGMDTPSHEDQLRFRWEFGDGTGSDWSSSPEVYHSYPLAGDYLATFWVKDPEGAVGSVDTTLHIMNEAPVGGILAPLDGAVFWKDEPVEFVPQGTDTPSDLDLLTFRWDFGDGNTTEWLNWRGSEPEHTYRRSGEFTITLEVRDDDGEVDTVEVAITVDNAVPVATVVRPWPSITVDEDRSVSFVGWGADSVTDEPLLTYEWLLEGEVHTGDRHTHVFTEAGTYEVFFRVIDPEGAEDVQEVEVIVLNVAPQVDASLTPLSITAGGSINFTAIGTDTPSDAETLSYSWDMGDGHTITTPGGTHTYRAPGRYDITVTVTDDDGETDSAAFTLLVNQRPEQPPVQPTDGDGTDGDDGTSWLVYAGVAAIAVIVILVLVVLVVLPRMASTEGPMEEMAQEPEVEPEEGSPSDDDEGTAG